MARPPGAAPMSEQGGSIRRRLSKMGVHDMAPEPRPVDWLSLLPPTLAAADLARLLTRMALARQRGQPVIWMCGAHVIKVGLNRVLIELMKHGWITHLAVNGAAIVHDVELALFGATSEDVESGLADGSFGQTEETNRWINQAIERQAHKQSGGLGTAIGAELLYTAADNVGHSLFAQALYLHIPVTVHVAMGTDVFQTHPAANGHFIGGLSLVDYRRFVKSLSRVTEGEPAGGVLLNWGSAVVLPEIALKAFSQLRAQDRDLSGLVSANFDMIQGYRGRTQIVERVKRLGGWGCAITGHHEIMLPLVAAQLTALDAVQKS